MELIVKIILAITLCLALGPVIEHFLPYTLHIRWDQIHGFNWWLVKTAQAMTDWTKPQAYSSFTPKRPTLKLLDKRMALERSRAKNSA